MKLESANRGTFIYSGVQPVSYTHLDVYKRQAVRLESANRGNFYIVGATVIILFTVFANK